MQIYKVGGCVRDRLLGLPVKDRDWVVVGADTQQMLDAGYKPVGRDFPVFLHPHTHEEYALARTERKQGRGYHGFEFHAEPDVTLEQDLARRDLTINAMAEDEDGTLIDPFNGQADLEKGLLRHVSPAFQEDPVRVLRLARFAARFNFSVAESTRTLISEMLADGELDYLVPERVWQETAKALADKKPSKFFTTLREVGALETLFPEVDRLFGVPQHPKWHPEVDTGVHVMMVLDQSARISEDLAVRYASLCHDLGKGTTPADVLPGHTGHEQRSVNLTRSLSERLRVPSALRDLAVKVAQYHTHHHIVFTLDAEQVLGVMEGMDCFRRPERFDQFLQTGEADFRGRPGYETIDIPQQRVWQASYRAACAIKPKPFVAQGLKGPQIAEAQRKSRLQAIDQVLSDYRASEQPA